MPPQLVIMLVKKHFSDFATCYGFVNRSTLSCNSQFAFMPRIADDFRHFKYS